MLVKGAPKGSRYSQTVRDQYWHKPSESLTHVPCNSPISQRFFLQRWAAWTPQISSWVITTHCRLYSNISQILLLYKTWRYCNKFDSAKSLVVCYRCVKITQCGYMKHGLKDIVFYIQKHITPQFHPTLYNECNHLSMLVFKLINASKRGPEGSRYYQTVQDQYWHTPSESLTLVPCNWH